MMTRRGFTLVEMMVAVTLTLAVFAITIPFVKAQSRALGANAGRLESEQIARFAQRWIDRELRAAAGDSGQPVLVQAGGMSLSFNANVLASDTTDPVALGVEAGADTTLTMSWRLANASVLPRTTVTYPTRNYTATDGGASRIETIHYFLHPDTISGRSDVYVLYRRVNARDSVAMVRGVYVPTGRTFFSYQRLVNGVLTDIPAAELPILWTNTAVDEIRAVVIQSGGFFRNRQTNTDVVRTASWITALPNRVREVSTACTGAPGEVDDLDVQKSGSTSRPFRVRLTWDASEDDGDETSNATKYVIERRLSTSATWVGILTISAVEFDDYEWTDNLPLLASGTYQYAVRVVGCGGELSPRTSNSIRSVTLP
jgi:prepilin-type N-terminal cleavage/methylation domain-containing protein